MLKISFSWDDGALEDLKLVDLCEKYAIPSMLFIPSENREGLRVLSPKDIKSIQSPIISIGAHTQHHTYLTELLLSDIYAEVNNNKNFLEDILGQKIQDFSFPGGKYNKTIFNVIKDEFNTFRTADTMCSQRHKKLIKPTFHFYPRGRRSLLLNAFRQRDSLISLCLKRMAQTDDYFELLRMLMTSMSESGKEFLVHIWGHSWEIEKCNLWQELEIMFSWIHQYHTQSICRYPAPYVE